MNQIDGIQTTEQIESTEVEQLELPGMPEPIVVTLTLEQIVDQFLEAMKMPELTMYQVAKALNATLETIGATKGFDDEGAPLAYVVRPQMVYQYARNGMVVKGRKSTDPISSTEARAFIIKFAAKFVK